MKINRAILLQRARACDGKQAFLSRIAAEETARAAHPGVAMDVYECRFCGKWHYGRDRRALMAQERARITQDGRR